MRLTREGNLILFMCEEDSERVWLSENTETEGWEWMGDSILAVDVRCAKPLAEAAQAEGFSLR